jgi:SMI1-KNR4 cell-wall
MPIESLKKIVPPPTRPSEGGNFQLWQAVEHVLGLVLPNDYREFVFTYGSVLFAQFYRVCSPFAASKYTALTTSVQRVCAAEREIKPEWPDQVLYPIYPKQPGFLPWGNDENGNDYCWLTEGASDTKRVLSDEVRGGFRDYGCTMTEFLTRVLLGEIEALAGDYSRDQNRFSEAWTT